MATRCYLFRQEHFPPKAAFPAVDGHNHLWDNWNVEELLKVMEAVGIICYCDLTANVNISWREGGYSIGRRRIEDFFENCVAQYPDKFYCFTAATFAAPTDKPLFEDSQKFVDETLELLNRHVKMGARGLKILKELGLHYK
ncbi:MAG: hypothetical protein KAU28_04110, partial [Phycisphaerae bacterium]|nr:hypothetical protein [Phycisphaerae bacterium]